MKTKKPKELEKVIGYKFVDKKLLDEALTHKSSDRSKNNERLEFLGDAVLNLIVGEYLFYKYPDSNEGILSKIRASLVNENSFMLLAKEIDLGSYITISYAEENNQGRYKASILSDAFEALIGAIFHEVGIEKVRHITYKLLHKVHGNITLDRVFNDYKTNLQELTQTLYATTPEYRLEREEGPDHKKVFYISVWIDNKKYSSAKGSSKKIAHQESAKIAIQKLREEKDKNGI
jgi:ribonuclease-3